MNLIYPLNVKVKMVMKKRKAIMDIIILWNRIMIALSFRIIAK